MARVRAASDLLQELKGLHHELELRLHGLERAIALPDPAWSDYGFARWALTRASRKRWLSLDQRVLPLIRQCGLNSPPIELLAIESADCHDRSEHHLRRWPLNRPITDWDKFRPASRAMRADMLLRIEAERRGVVPVLQNIAERR